MINEKKQILCDIDSDLEISTISEILYHEPHIQVKIKSQKYIKEFTSGVGRSKEISSLFTNSLFLIVNE